jgi:hypothetical protein
MSGYPPEAASGPQAFMSTNFTVLPQYRFPHSKLCLLSSYQLLSTSIIGRRWWNPIAFGGHALSIHGVISCLQ